MLTIKTPFKSKCTNCIIVVISISDIDNYFLYNFITTTSASRWDSVSVCVTVCACVYVCACLWERRRESGKEKERACEQKKNRNRKGMQALAQGKLRQTTWERVQAQNNSKMYHSVHHQVVRVRACACMSRCMCVRCVYVLYVRVCACVVHVCRMCVESQVSTLGEGCNTALE